MNTPPIAIAIAAVAGVALAAVVIVTPLVTRLAVRLGAVAHPGGRHVHTASIPRLGGLALAVAFFAGLLVIPRIDAAATRALVQEPWQLVGLIVGGAAMCAVGAVDDVRGVRALYKLYAQIAVAVFAFKCGFCISAVHMPFIGDLVMGIFALPVTVLWIVGVVNAVNLIDGLDGLAAGVVFFAASTNLVVAMLNGSVFVGLLSAATGGAVLGFLLYNFNPARIFMGDSGSYFLGYVLAVTSLVSQKASTAVSLLVPIVALGVPIFDTLFAMVRRILERRPVFSPDRGHIHHRLLDMGITHRRAVLIIYGVCVAFTASAIVISMGRSWEIGLALLCASAVLVGLVRFAGYFELTLHRNRQKARLRSRDIEVLRRAVPKVLAVFAQAATEDELFEAVGQFARDAEIDFVEAIETSAENAPIAYRWSKADAMSAESRASGPASGPRAQRRDGAARDMVTARYPIGRDDVARAALKFGWVCDFNEVSPQNDILLQVVTDVFEKHLIRLHGRLSPVVVEVERVSSLPATARSATVIGIPPSQPAMSSRRA